MKQQNLFTETYAGLQPVKFQGSDYAEEFDYGRLSGALRRVYDAMKCGQWQTTFETAERASVKNHETVTRMRRHIKNMDGHSIEKRRRGNKEDGLFEYRIIRMW